MKISGIKWNKNNYSKWTIAHKLSNGIELVSLTFTLHTIINDPGIMNVHIVNVIAYHNEFASVKCGKQIPMSLYKRYGATSNNGGIVPSRATNQPHTKPQITWKFALNYTHRYL